MVTTTSDRLMLSGHDVVIMSTSVLFRIFSCTHSEAVGPSGMVALGPR